MTRKLIVVCVAAQMITFSATAISQNVGNGLQSVVYAQTEVSPDLGAAESPGESNLKNGAGAVLNSGDRISSVSDARGIRHELAYDGLGRIYAITQPSEHEIVVLHYLPDSKAPDKPDAVSLIDTETGKQLKYVLLRGNHKKYLSPDDPDFVDLINQVLTIQDPFSEDYFYNWGLPPIPPIPSCTVSDCDTICDAGSVSALLYCGEMTLVSGPGAAICGAVIAGAWATCRYKCRVSCR
jgi:hypothetical protein